MMDASFRLNVTGSEWERIASLGSGVLFREGEPFSEDLTSPPAEFVEAAQVCPYSHCIECGRSDQINGRSETVIMFDEGFRHSICDDRWDQCCLDGKRRVAVVVPCPTCSIKQDGRIRPGLELCTRCVPRHWEFCSTCTVWSDDEFMITSKAGFITVGHVVVTWGPLVVVDWHSLQPWHPRVSVQGNGRVLLHRHVDEPTIDLGYPLLPDIDSQTLVGQYALGIQVVS